ncbi:MAG: hypothetical protein DMG61_15825 [Acidobacteria bacterium]|nr:MAG: hypothetical protein DMG61_15825 [Acidobacteriota bacterium]
MIAFSPGTKIWTTHVRTRDMDSPVAVSGRRTWVASTITCAISKNRSTVTFRYLVKKFSIQTIISPRRHGDTENIKKGVSGFEFRFRLIKWTLYLHCQSDDLKQENGSQHHGIAVTAEEVFHGKTAPLGSGARAPLLN